MGIHCPRLRKVDAGLPDDGIAHLDPEFGALGSVANREMPPHVLLYDGFRHEETNPGPLLWPLGGEVGFEDLVYDLLGYPSRVVGYRYQGTLPFPGNGYGHPGIANRPFHQDIPGVYQDVEENLGELVAVSVDYRVVFRDDLYGYILTFETIFQKCQRIRDRLAHVEVGFFLVRPEVVPEIVDGSRHVLDEFHRGSYGVVD